MPTHRGSRTLATGKGTEAITPTLLTWPHSPALKAGSEKQRALESSCLALALLPQLRVCPPLQLLVQWAHCSFTPVLEAGVGELLGYPGRKVLFLQSTAHLLPPYSPQPIFCLLHPAVSSPLLRVVTMLPVPGPQILISLKGRDGGTGPGLVA